MSGSGSSHDAPQTVSTRDLWGEDANPAARPYDGGSGAPGFVKQVEREALHGQDRPTRLAEPAGGGDPGWWEQSNHASQPGVE